MPKMYILGADVGGVSAFNFMKSELKAGDNGGT